MYIYTASQLNIRIIDLVSTRLKRKLAYKKYFLGCMDPNNCMYRIEGNFHGVLIFVIYGLTVKPGLWTLDSGLDPGLDYGLDYGLDHGLNFNNTQSYNEMYNDVTARMPLFTIV